MIPPHDTSAEKAVLGSILLRPDVFSLVRTVVSNSDFYSMAHQLIYQAMVELHAKQVPIDVQTVGTYLMSQEQLEQIGGAITLSELTDATVTAANAEHYARTVMELAARRRLIWAAQEVVQSGFKTSIDTEQYFADSKTAISSVEFGAAPRSCSFAQIVDASIADSIRSEMPHGFIHTGIIGDIPPGVMTIIAGRPSMGKSVLALNVAITASLRGLKGLIFSLEDTKELVMTRTLARFAKVECQRIIKRRISDHERRAIEAQRDVVASIPITVDDTSGLSADAIRHRCVVQADRSGLDYVIVDNLSNVRKSKGPLFDSFSECASQLNEIPRELGIPFVLLSQLNREVEKRENRVPIMADLRQTGELEQLARLIMFVMRESSYPERYPNANPNEMHVYVAKNTHGDTGRTTLYCDLPHMTITRMERDDAY